MSVNHPADDVMCLSGIEKESIVRCRRYVNPSIERLSTHA